MTRRGIGVDIHRYFHVIEYRPRRSLIDLIVVRDVAPAFCLQLELVSCDETCKYLTRLDENSRV